MMKRALTRLSLIVALVMAAHALKPISGESISTHLLDAIDSFAFVLPNSTSAQLAQANYIAAAFGRGFSAPENTREGVWMQPAVAAADPAAMHAVSECGPGIALRTERRTRKPGNRPARLVAKSRIKPVELPAAMPLDRALAVSLPLIQVSLAPTQVRQMTAYRLTRPMRVLRPIPISLPKSDRRIDCDPPTIKTRIADEVIAPAEAPMAGPMEAPMAEALNEAEALESAIELVTPPMTMSDFSVIEPPRQSCEVPQLDPNPSSPFFYLRKR